MSIKVAIQNRDEKLLVEDVNKAVEIYASAVPAEVKVNTVFGEVPFSLLVDEDSKWNTITAAYVEVTQKVEALPKGVDRKVEIAKLIATNPVLRNVGSSSNSSDDLL